MLLPHIAGREGVLFRGAQRHRAANAGRHPDTADRPAVARHQPSIRQPSHRLVSVVHLGIERHIVRAVRRLVGDARPDRPHRQARLHSPPVVEGPLAAEPQLHRREHHLVIVERLHRHLVAIVQVGAARGVGHLHGEAAQAHAKRAATACHHATSARLHRQRRVAAGRAGRRFRDWQHHRSQQHDRRYMRPPHHHGSTARMAASLAAKVASSKPWMAPSTFPERPSTTR